MPSFCHHEEFSFPLMQKILIRYKLIWMVLWEIIPGHQMAPPLIRFHGLSFRSSQCCQEVISYYVLTGPWPLQLKISREFLRTTPILINVFHFAGKHYSLVQNVCLVISHVTRLFNEQMKIRGWYTIRSSLKNVDFIDRIRQTYRKQQTKQTKENECPMKKTNETTTTQQQKI